MCGKEVQGACGGLASLGLQDGDEDARVAENAVILPATRPLQAAAYYEAKKKLRALRAKAEAQVA